MTIFGNTCVALIGLGSYWMFVLTAESGNRYDYLVTIMMSLILLVLFFGAYASIASTGGLDFLGWSRPLQYGGIAIASLSLTILMGTAAAYHGSGGSEFKWGIRPFCPWAAYMVPLALALIALLWLNSNLFALPVKPLRAAFGVTLAIAIVSNIVFGAEVALTLKRNAAEVDRETMRTVQSSDPEQEFGRLLTYTGKLERPSVRELALHKLFSTGPKFNTLLTECLRNDMHQGALTFLRDNDPPGDLAPLAEPARDGVLLSAERMRQAMNANGGPTAEELTSGIDSALGVVDKFSKFGVDFMPAVRQYRAALNTPSYAKVPPASLRKIDNWPVERNPK